jgi:hypothetical protein
MYRLYWSYDPYPMIECKFYMERMAWITFDRLVDRLDLSYW